jgi:hypothetical protein
LLLAWLEEEGARQRRRVALPLRVGDPAVRGWVHVVVCALVGALAVWIFCCGLARAWDEAAQAAAREGVRVTQCYGTVDAGQGFDAETAVAADWPSD